MTETKTVNENHVQGSEIAGDFIKHMSAMAQIEGLEVGNSFATAREGFQGPLLVDLAIDASKGRLCFVVIEHPEVFEVQRLPDGSSWKLFYKYNPTQNRNKQVSKRPVDMIKKACGDYLRKPIEMSANYDKKLNQQMKDKRIISYALLQRRLASVAIFRKSPNGSSGELKLSVDALIEIGYLRELEPEELETHNTIAKLFEIME